ncbi:MAG: cyclic nucleotide-binding domain-containing protein [Planctomycetia bacterium]|nr:cyclic nucleotide-binding domain-containing protein [Planctomycetia bacterium]
MVSPEMLRRYPQFADMSEENLKELAMIATERTFAAGEVLFHEGDSADQFHVILSGEVDIQYTLGSGECRTVDTLVSGDILCWSALVAPYKDTVNGTATKDTHVVAINAGKLRELCAEDSSLGYLLMTQVVRLLAHRLEIARVQLAAT